MTPQRLLPLPCGNCGALILVELQVEGSMALGESHEVAVTCDCGKANWLVLTAVEPEL